MTTLKADDEIALRQISMADAPELFSILKSNRTYLRRWLPWVDSIRNMRHEREWIEGRLAAMEKGQDYPFVIVYRGMMVGVLEVSEIDSPNKACEVGYWLAEIVQGQGIVTRACRAVLTSVFGELGLSRVQIRAPTDNKRSRAIPERLGFVLEETLSQALLLNGEYHDLAVYSMLASEWRDR